MHAKDPSAQEMSLDANLYHDLGLQLKKLGAA
jgi:hypothetical protein